MNYDKLDVPLYSEDQSPKDCKKTTPNYKDANPKKGIAQEGYKMKDNVYVKGTTLVNKLDMDGRYIFDGYDKYDNTCYVINGTMTYNVLLSDIILVKKI